MVNLCYGCGHPLIQDQTTQYWRCDYCGLIQSTPIMQGGFYDDRSTSGGNIVPGRILGI